MSVKELTGLSLTDLWEEYQSSFKDFCKRQRCWAHKLRNVANYFRKKDLKECINGARKIYSASSRSEAIKERKAWTTR